jgi:hypothetical protein
VHHRCLGPRADVVAIEGDVELAQRDVVLEQVTQQALQALGKNRATPVDTDQGKRVWGPASPAHASGLGTPWRIVVLDDLVRDAHERTAHVVPVEDDLLI